VKRAVKPLGKITPLVPWTLTAIHATLGSCGSPWSVAPIKPIPAHANGPDVSNVLIGAEGGGAVSICGAVGDAVAGIGVGAGVTDCSEGMGAAGDGVAGATVTDCNEGEGAGAAQPITVMRLRAPTIRRART